jgi:hypothetical protein
LLGRGLVGTLKNPSTAHDDPAAFVATPSP